MIAVCHLYGWKLKVFLTLRRIISNPDIVVLMYLILGISYFDTVFACVLWRGYKSNYRGDGF